LLLSVLEEATSASSAAVPSEGMERITIGAALVSTRALLMIDERDRNSRLCRSRFLGGTSR
jgi:hypothetical protein